MQVQLNTDHNLTGSEPLAARVSGDLEDALSHYSERLTRVEVHLNDVNAGKGGARDKRCMLEARMKGHEPVAVTHEAESVDLALSGATDKLVAALEHRIGRMNADTQKSSIKRQSEALE
ncbi:MAG: HPF/RaiA family ribosome-associated protein [Burkholderiaceae bacterium]|jgi:hypothetical protein|nr:HPF/RaiA family ribosome-associated protein [Burkholderiaceae bacterium]